MVFKALSVGSHILGHDWAVQTFRVQAFQPIILIFRRANFVYRDWRRRGWGCGCTSIYRSAQMDIS